MLEAQGLPEGWTRAWDADSAGARAPLPKLLRVGAATRPPLGWAKTMTRPDGLASSHHTYLVELTATSTSTGAVGESAMIVRANLPPSGGVLVASPPSGAPFGSSVELAASSFDDDDQPLPPPTHMPARAVPTAPHSLNRNG